MNSRTSFLISGSEPPEDQLASFGYDRGRGHHGTHFLRRGGPSLPSVTAAEMAPAGFDVDAPALRSASTQPQTACLRGSQTRFRPVFGRFGPTRARVCVVGRIFASGLTTQYADLQELSRERRDSNP